MSWIVDYGGFEFDFVSKIFLPIKKWQNSVEFANVVAFKEFHHKSRLNGGNAYHNHAIPIAFDVFDALNDTKYKIPAIVAALLHDLSEEYFKKYDVANPTAKDFNANYDVIMNSSNPVFINSLFKNKTKNENDRINFILYLLTKRPELGINSYWENLGMAFKYDPEILSRQICFDVVKLYDISNNIDPNENYMNKPKLLENKFRNGLDRLFYDIPAIESFLFNEEVIKLGIFDVNKIKFSLNEIKGKIIDFYRPIH